MAFKLGVVGHKDTLAMVSDLVDEYFDQVKVYPEEFSNDEVIEDAVERISDLQTRCDGLLYSRREPYLLISEHLQHTIPVSFVDIQESHLLISLLKAMVRYGIRPTKLSIDTFDRALALEAFQTVGIPEDALTIYTVAHDSSQDDVVNATLAGHLRNCALGADLCITNITDVCRSLNSRNLPCVVINPSPRSFVHEIRNLMLRYQLKNQSASPLAVLHIKLQYKEKYRFQGKMSIREVEELSHAMKLITIFAEKLDGAMYSLSRWEYLIVCSGPLLQDATDQFSEIGLMQTINYGTVFDVAMGIGCGKTIQEAEHHAVIAANHTLAQRGTNAFVALDLDQLIGPLRPKSEHFTDESTTDARLEEIARDTGLSTGVLHKLFQAILTHNSRLFTTEELAEILGSSTRTVNRMIERLLDHNYAVIEGKNLSQTRGRPARVIRLVF